MIVAASWKCRFDGQVTVRGLAEVEGNNNVGSWDPTGIAECRLSVIATSVGCALSGLHNLAGSPIDGKVNRKGDWRQVKSPSWTFVKEE